MIAAWPTTVTKSRWPRAFALRTQKPFSALWKVTRSTRPASTSWVDGSRLDFIRIAGSSVLSLGATSVEPHRRRIIRAGQRADGARCRARTNAMDGRNRRIVWKNSIFRVDHNLNGNRRPWRKIRQGFGRTGELAACGSPMRLIVAITRADEVRCVKSRFSRPVILRVFPHNRREADVADHCLRRLHCADRGHLAPDFWGMASIMCGGLRDSTGKRRYSGS